MANKQVIHYPELDSMVNNILLVFDSIDDAELKNFGINWYSIFNEHLSDTSADLGVSHNIFTAIVSVLSPNVNWNKNIENAISVVSGSGSNTSYPKNIEKANLILMHGNIYNHLSGAKVRPFYHNLMYPESSAEITIDSHATKIAIGKNVPSDYAYKFIRGRDRLDRVKTAYQIASEMRGLKPLQMQSATWCMAVESNGYDLMNDYNVY